MKNLFQSASCGNPAKKFIYMGEVMGQNNEVESSAFKTGLKIYGGTHTPQEIDDYQDQDFLAKYDNMGQVESQETEPPYKKFLDRIINEMVKSALDGRAEKIRRHTYERTVKNVSGTGTATITYKLKKKGAELTINALFDYKIKLDDDNHIISLECFQNGEKVQLNENKLTALFTHIGTALEYNW